MLFFASNKSKKFTAIAILMALFLGLFLVDVGEARADNVFTAGLKYLIAGQIAKAQAGLQFVMKAIVGSFAEDIIGGLTLLISMGAHIFMGFCADIFTGVLKYTVEIMKSSTIYDGWKISRDFINMFFILGLVVIAFATILKIETYGMKALLPKLIIMALLINFSYLACGIIIDASHVTANFFVKDLTSSQKDPQNIGVGRQIMSDIIRDPVDVPAQSYKEDKVNDFFVLIISTLMGATFKAIAGFVLLIGAILLIIRMAGLWILIILAPFAWFLGIFPKLNAMSGKWWNTFLKYVFFAPIFVFFIWLARGVSSSLNVGLLTINAPDSFLEGAKVLTEFLIAVIIFGGAPIVAMSSGIYGASAVIRGAKNVIRGTAKLPFRLQRVAATIAPPAWMEKKAPFAAKLVRGVQKTAAYTSLAFWKKAVEARKAERQRKARIGYIVGKQQDLLNRVFSLWSEKTNFAEQAEQFEVAEKKKDVDAETKRVGSRLRAKLKDAQKQKDVVTYKACMELLQEQGDTNDTMIFDDMFDEFKYDDKYALEKNKGQNVNDPKNRRFSNLGFKHGVIGQMRQMGLSDKQIAPFLGKLQEIALQSGYYGGYGMADTDEKGNMTIATDEKQIETATAKVKVMTARARTSKLHTTALVAQGVDKKGQYKFADRDDVGDEILRTFTPADVKETSMQYVRPDTRTVVDQAYTAGALKGISEAADALGEKFHEEIAGIPKKVKKEVGKEAEKTKEEVKKELEDLGLPK